jgi:hypothetical protein
MNRLIATAALVPALACASPALADCSPDTMPKIGMAKADLPATCWEFPTKIIKRTTSSGVEETYFFTEGQVKFVAGRIAEIVEVVEVDPTSAILRRLKKPK